MNVFVYGTLMQGFPNHQIIAEYIDEIHEAGVEGKLYAVGGFPGLIEGDGEVKGELLVIDEDFKKEVLNKLDRLEGCPDLFKREKKQVLMPENGAKKEAWVYIYNSDDYAEDDLIKSGCWKGYKEA